MRKEKTKRLLKFFLSEPQSFFIAFACLFFNSAQAIDRLKMRYRNFNSGYTYRSNFDLNSMVAEMLVSKYKPLISLVMPVYNAEVSVLSKAIESVKSQIYENWELCICDDGSSSLETIEYLKLLKDDRIKVVFLPQNQGISAATNKAIEISNGEYIAFIDNDDEITRDALYEVFKAIKDSGADFVYSDEDFISLDGSYISPHFKSDLNPELLLSHNYITHFVVVKRSLGEALQWLRTEYDGAQDYDFILRATEVASYVVHIPKVLYHWRMSETSTSFDSSVKPLARENGRLAVIDALKRRNIQASVFYGNLDFFYRVSYDIMGSPLVSIIVPFRDNASLLKMCIESVISKSTYQNFELICVNNGSHDEATYIEIERLKQLDSRVKFFDYDIPFNYSMINNYAVNHCSMGKHIVLLNNDIEIISPNWIEEMLMYSQNPKVGCVGAKLYYPNGKIQHAGVIIGLGGYAAHSHRLHGRDSHGYFNRLNVVQNLSAVTAACLMVKRAVYLEMKGLNEVDFAVAFNDVDFCLRVLKTGYMNVFTPYAEAYHYESMSRGDDIKDKAKRERFKQEKASLLRYHGDFIARGDPFYNRNLNHDNEYFQP